MFKLEDYPNFLLPFDLDSSGRVKKPVKHVFLSKKDRRKRKKRQKMAKKSRRINRR